MGDVYGKKSELRVQAAFSHAFTDLLMKKPLESIAVSEIIQQAGYSRTTFYAYYQDKYDMADQVVNHMVTQFANAVCSAIPQTTQMRFDSLLYEPGLNMFHHVLEYRDFYHLLINNLIPGHGLDAFSLEVCEIFKRVLSVEMADKSLCLNLDLYFYINTHTYFLFIKYWELHDFCYTPEYMAEQMMTNWIKLKKISGVSARFILAENCEECSHKRKD